MKMSFLKQTIKKNYRQTHKMDYMLFAGIRSISITVKIYLDQNQERQNTEFKKSSLKKRGIPFCYFDKKPIWRNQEKISKNTENCFILKNNNKVYSLLPISYEFIEKRWFLQKHIFSWKHKKSSVLWFLRPVSWWILSFFYRTNFYSVNSVW